MKKYPYTIAFILFFNSTAMATFAAQRTPSQRKFTNQTEYDVTEEEIKGLIRNQYRHIAKLPFQHILFSMHFPHTSLSHTMKFDTTQVKLTTS